MFFQALSNENDDNAVASNSFFLLSQTKWYELIMILKWPKKIIKSFRSEYLIGYRLKNTVAASFNTTVRLMTGKFQWPKFIRKKWRECLRQKKQRQNLGELSPTLPAAALFSVDARFGRKDKKLRVATCPMRT